jgi:nucleoside-diphosphate-sugar epimerase
MHDARAVLVTGASGFTGGHLARALVAEGARVVAFVRSTSEVTALQRLGVETRVVNLCDRDDVSKHFEPFSCVFHIAAAFRLQHPDLDEFRRVNVEATQHLLEAARESGVSRFVHCSTVGVQGHIAHPPASEDTPFGPGDRYQETKLAGELLAQAAMKETALEVAVVRPAGIYGPGDTRFLKLFRAIARRTFVMVGSGHTLYHLTHVSDVVQGLLLAGSHPAAPGGVFTIAGDRYVSLRELVELIAGSIRVAPPRLKIPYWPVHAAAVVSDRVFRLVGLSPPLYPRRVEFFVKDRAFDISKARSCPASRVHSAVGMLAVPGSFGVSCTLAERPAAANPGSPGP